MFGGRAIDGLRPVAQSRGVAFLLNDRPELVRATGVRWGACGADGYAGAGGAAGVGGGAAAGGDVP